MFHYFAPFPSKSPSVGHPSEAGNGFSVLGALVRRPAGILFFLDATPSEVANGGVLVEPYSALASSSGSYR